LIPHLDDLAVRLCDSLHCPPQMTVAFENSMIGRYSFFSGGQPMMIFPSPHLLALPTDARSRDELYRALETRLVRLLIFQASGAHFYSNRMVSREITRWELSRVGLTGPFITEAIARTLATELHSGAAQPLGTISLRSGSPETDTPGEAMLSLALAFLDQSLGNGTVERLIPAMDSSATLGDAIRTALPVNPETLEPAWQRYLRAETGLSAKSILLSGDLALRCENDNGKSSIWHIWADGTELAQISDDKQDAWLPTWSPDGKWLAYIQNDRVMVMNANSRQAEAVVEGLSEQAPFGWLSDDRLQVTEQDRARLINLHTSQDIVITGTQHVWSPDGRHVAYLDFPLGATYPAAGRDAPQIWIADTDGRNARLVGRGYGLEWSPDSTRLAFLGDVHVYSSVPNHLGFVYAREVQIVDVASGSAATLARGSDLLQSLSDNKGATGMMTNLTWSPDSSNIAVGMWRPGGFSMVWVLSAKSGAVLAQRSGTAVWWPYRAWSPDSRHLAVWATVSSQQDTLSLMDVQTGQSVELPVNKLNVSSGNWFEQLSSNAFDWSPDGNWLAVAQEPSGVLLVAQDLTDMRWLDTPHCFSVTWKPG
jgi:Tol biopolymer transport system component